MYQQQCPTVCTLLPSSKTHNTLLPAAVFINRAWKPKKSYPIQMTFEAWLLSLNTNDDFHDKLGRVRSVGCSLLSGSPRGTICLSPVSRWPLCIPPLFLSLLSFAVCHTLLKKANSLHVKETLVTVWITRGLVACFHDIWRTGRHDWERICPCMFRQLCHSNFLSMSCTTNRDDKERGQSFAKKHVNLSHLWNCVSDSITVRLWLVY